MRMTNGDWLRRGIAILLTVCVFFGSLGSLPGHFFTAYAEEDEEAEETETTAETGEVSAAGEEATEAAGETADASANDQAEAPGPAAAGNNDTTAAATAGGAEVPAEKQAESPAQPAADRAEAPATATAPAEKLTGDSASTEREAIATSTETKDGTQTAPTAETIQNPTATEGGTQASAAEGTTKVPTQGEAQTAAETRDGVTSVTEAAGNRAAQAPAEPTDGAPATTEAAGDGVAQTPAEPTNEVPAATEAAGDGETKDQDRQNKEAVNNSAEGTDTATSETTEAGKETAAEDKEEKEPAESTEISAEDKTPDNPAAESTETSAEEGAAAGVDAEPATENEEGQDSGSENEEGQNNGSENETGQDNGSENEEGQDSGSEDEGTAADTVTVPVSAEAKALAAMVAQPVMLTQAATATPGETTDLNTSGNTAADIAASVEFQDPIYPSNNPVPVVTLQKLIEERMAMTGSLSGTLSMQLGRNTTYTGDVSIKRIDLGKVADDFRLEIASEDAGEDGLSADGSTVIDGNLLFEGVNVIMKGVRMALDRVITVVAGKDKINGDMTDASLSYYGTTADDLLTVEAGNRSEVDIHTGEGDDRVGLTTSNSTKSTAMDTGTGDDTVYAFIYGGTSELSTGTGDDTVELYTYADRPEQTEPEDAGEAETETDIPVRVDTGEGNDTLLLALTGSAGVEAVTGPATTNEEQGTAEIQDDDTVTVYGRYGAGDLHLKTGNGSDRVNITKNYSAPDLVRVVPDGKGIKDLEYRTMGDGFNPNASAEMHIDLGTGNNRLDLDMSVGDNFAAVNLDGLTPIQVHLTGILKEALAEGEKPITGDARDLAFRTENGNTLRVKTTAENVTNRFSDQLENKEKVYLYAGVGLLADEQFAEKRIAPENFVDYVLKANPKNMTLIPFQTGSETLLTNLVVDADEIHGSDRKAEVGTVYIPGVNLLLRGEEVHFHGDVVADTVMAYAKDNNTRPVMEELKDIFEAEDALEVGEEIAEFLLSFLNIYHHALVEVHEDARVIAAHDVDLVSTVEETGSMISVLPNMINLLNVKIGLAEVKVDGTVMAGYRPEQADADNAAIRPAGSGNILLDASVKSMAGYKQELTETDALQATTGYRSVPYLAAIAFPVAVNLIVSDSSVTVGKTAVLEAKGDVALRAVNESRAIAKAASGTAQIPISAAANIISAEAKAIVLGEVTAAGNVLILSRGSQKSTAQSLRGSDQTALNSGLYGALNVVAQEVASRIGRSDDDDLSIASVRAGGHVRLVSQTLAEARTEVSSGVNPNSPRSSSSNFSGGFGKLMSTILGKIVDKIVDKIKGKDAKALKAAESFLGNPAVTVERVNDPGDDAGGTITGGQSKLMGDHSEVNGTYSVKAGYEGKVRYRYLQPGEDHYTIGYASMNEELGTYRFELPVPIDYCIVELISTQKEGKEAVEGKETGDGIRSAGEILSDATGGAKGNADEESGEGTVKITFSSGATGEGAVYGALVNKKCDENGKSILKTDPGDTLEIIPNPKSGYRLKDKTLTVRYYASTDSVASLLEVKEDAEGRYIFKVPTSIRASGGLEIQGVFEGDGGAYGKKGIKDYQIVGSAGLVVVLNHSDATITAAAEVEAEEAVDVRTTQQTRVPTSVDGTAITPQNLAMAQAAAAASSGYKQQKIHEEFTIPGAKYAVRMTSSPGGTVTQTTTGSREDGIHYQFAVRPEDGNRIGGVLVSYFQGEDIKTLELEAKEETDGGWIYELDLSKLGTLSASTVTEGSTVTVGFTFEEDESGETVSGTDNPDSYLVRNPISIRTNVLNDSSETDINQFGFSRIGNVYFLEEKEGKYFFRVSPEESKGYTIKAENTDIQHPERSNIDALFASYLDGNGVTRRVQMWRDVNGELGVWYLDPSEMAVPAGSVITVNATFTPHMYPIQAKADNGSHGTVALSGTEVKKGDSITITAVPDTDYSWPQEALVKYYYGIKPMEVKVPLDSDGRGTFTFEKTMDPVEVYGFTVSAEFKPKDIELYNLSSTGDLTLKDNRVSLGQSVEVTLSEQRIAEGYKFKQVTLTGDGWRIDEVPVNNGHFVIPEDWTNIDVIKVTVTPSDFIQKEIPIRETTIEPSRYKAKDEGKNIGGTLTPVSGRADRGETVQVKVTPFSGCRVVKGSAMAKIYIGQYAKPQEVQMTQVAQDTWTFTVPVNVSRIENAYIELTAEFEEGTDNYSTTTFSVGAGVGVQVVDADNKARVEGSVESGGLSLTARTSATDRLTVKAGYSQGEIGIGGAVAAQLSGYTTEARVLPTARLNIREGGDLTAQARTGITFALTADASGQKTESTSVGVGAGIAAAVRGTDTRAAVEDGVRMYQPALGTVHITAAQSLTESVQARAGSTGGTSVTPVLALNIFGSGAESYLGAFRGNEGNEGITVRDLRLNASNDVRHTVTANANTAGKMASIGAAFGLSLIRDLATAKLRESVRSRGQVTVTSANKSTLNANVIAGAAGGLQGTTNETGKSGSSDRQANKAIHSASALSSGHKSANVTTKGATDRQKAQTTEGSIAGAGAFALSLLFTTSEARVEDGINVHADGAMKVISINRTQATVKANASATRSNVGVGVGAAVNFVDLVNRAYVGNGEISAASLEVAARMPESAGSAISREQKTTAPQTLDAFTKQIHDLICEAFKDEDGTTWLPVDLVATFAAYFANSFLDQTGLKQILGEGDFESKLDRAEDFFFQFIEHLYTFPQALLEPVKRLYDDVVETAGMTREEWENAIDSVASDLIRWIPGEAMSILDQAGWSLAYSLIGQGLTYVSDQLRKMEKPTLMDFVHGGVEILKESVTTVLNIFLTDLIEEATTMLAAEIPLLSRERLDLLLSQLPETPAGAVEGARQTAQWVKSEDKLDSMATTAKNKGIELVNYAAEYFLKTFKANVFDYEAILGKIHASDIPKLLKDSLETALKDAGVAVTNQLISGIVDKLDLSLQPEGTTDKHYLNTQAVSGAGAESVGVAGSAALTVYLGKTVAEIARGSRLEIQGDTKIWAKETRRITDIATAAVDPTGEADTNERAASRQSADVGSGSSGTTTVEDAQKHVTITSMAGGSAAFDDEDASKVHITPRDGFRLADETSVTVEKEDGSMETLPLQKYGDNSWLLDCSKCTAYGQPIHITIEFEEALSILPEPRAYVNTVEQEPLTDKVTLKVEGRENDPGRVQARAGEKVLVEIKADENHPYSIPDVYYILKDDQGNEEKVGVYACREVGADYEFSFLMPTTGTVTAIEVAYDYYRDNEKKAEEKKKKSRDESGKTVGVGASFALIYGNGDAKAILDSDEIKAGSLTVKANGDHQENVNAVSGTDPLTSGKKTQTKVKDVSFDAAVALSLLDNDILARVAEDATVSTKAYTDAAGNPTAGDLTVQAGETGSTWIRSSGYATGDTAAVGASGAINLGFTDIKASLGAKVNANGQVTVDASSHSEDRTHALATAVGADIQRYLDKFAHYEQITESLAQSVADGSIVDKLDRKLFGHKNKNNDTAKRVNQRLDDTKDSGGTSADATQPVTVNALKSQDVKTADSSGAKDASSIAGAEVSDASGMNVATDRDTGESSKVQIAAAVGFTFARHRVTAQSLGHVTADGGISLTANNAANFNTMGTGAAMSLANKANSIALAAALSVSGNKAIVNADGDLLAQKDITLSAALTQNMDGEYRGKLGAQALSGAVSGADSAVSIAGSVSALLSRAVTKVQTGGGEKDAQRIKGKNVTVSATDKTKLAARAGGLSISKGSSVGAGLAATLILSGNTVSAGIGDNTDIEAASLSVTADKQGVTFKDYSFPLSLKNVMSDSSKLSADQRQNVETGIIDVKRGATDKGYTVSINVRSTDLLKLFDLANIFSSVNYYAEAVAGALSQGKNGGKLSLGGSAAVTVFTNRISAILGDRVRVRLTGTGEDEGGMTLSAAGDTNARLIAGALSGGNSKVGIGLSFDLVNDDDVVTAKAGDGTSVEAAGDVKITSASTGDIQVFNAAATVGTSSDTAAVVGGSMNVLHDRHIAETELGENVSITAQKGLEITSDTDIDLIAITASLNGSGGKAAAGGTLQLIVNQASSEVTLGSGHLLTSGGDTVIAANIREQLIAGSASASAALSSGGASVAGNLAALVTLSKAFVQVKNEAGAKGKIESLNGSVTIDADSDTRIIDVMISAAGGTGVAVGANIGLGVFGRQARIEIEGGETAEDYTIRAKENILTRAGGRDTVINASMALSGGTGSAAVAGTFILNVARSRVKTIVKEAASFEAGNNAAFDAYHSSLQIMVGGTLSATSGSAGVAASTLNLGEINEVETDLGRSRVLAQAAGKQVNLRDHTDVNGIHVGAKSAETQVLIGVGFAAGSSAGVTGTLMTIGIANVIRAKTEDAELKHTGNGRADAGIRIFADNDVVQAVAAGSVNGGGSAGVGASAMSQVNLSLVEALAGNTEARGDLAVTADSEELYVLAAVNIGASGAAAVEVGVAIQPLLSCVRAVQTGAATAGRNYTLTAHQDVNAIDVFTSLAVAGEAAVTPIGVVTYARGKTEAVLERGATLTLKNPGYTAQIHASSDKDIYEYILGGAASGTAGVSGTVALTVGQELVSALAKEGSQIDLNGSDLDIKGHTSYQMQSITGAFGVAGVAGVAVNAALNVLMDSTTAALDGKVNNAGKVSVNADSLRDMIGTVANVTVSSTASVGVSVIAFAAGQYMSQDAADMLTYGNAKDKSGDTKTFDPESFLNSAAAEGLDTSEISDIGEFTQGDGTYHSQMSVGKEGADFDATSGVLSSDFDNKEFIDEDSAVQRGENQVATDSEDIANARNMGVYTYSNTPGDALTARIGSTAEVNAKNVAVNADQSTVLDLYGGSVSVSGVAGVGVTTAMAVLFSNVTASSAGTVRLEDGDLSIKAVSRAGEVTIADSEEETERANALITSLNGVDTPTKRTLRLVGLTGAVGITGAGVGVAAAALVTANQTRALLSGTASGVRNLAVESTGNYDHVMVASVAGSGGLVAVSGAVAVALSNAEITAEIAENAKVSRETATGKGTYHIGTVSNYGVNTYCATACIGVGGLNAGLAFTGNRIVQNTGIREGATVRNSGSGALKVDARSISTAVSDTLAANVSGIAIAPAASVAIAAPKIKTRISGATVTTPNMDITVANQVQTTALPGIANIVVTVGGGSGNVLLAFVLPEAEAKVEKTKTQAQSLAINAGMDALSDAHLTSGTMSGIGVGLGVTYAELSGSNRAQLDVSREMTLYKGVRVSAGTEDKRNITKANAVAWSGGVSLISISANAAVARNLMENSAKIMGESILNNGSGQLADGKTIRVEANQDAEAHAEVDGFDVGWITVAPSVAVSLMEAKQSATMDLSRLLSLDLGMLGKREWENLTLQSDLQAKTKAKLLTGGGSMMNHRVNVAVAYGRAQSTAEGTLRGESGLAGSLDVINRATDETKVSITNQTFSGISANAMVSAAHTQDVFRTALNLNLNGETMKAGKGVNVVTDYGLSTISDVTPSASGVDKSAVQLNVNVSVAKSKADISTVLSGHARLEAEDVKVDTQGYGDTQAIITTPNLVRTTVAVNPNIAYAHNAAIQRSVLGGTIEKPLTLGVRGSVSVLSGTDAEKHGTKTVLGGSGWGKESTKVSVTGAEVRVNVGKAIDEMTSQAVAQCLSSDANRKPKMEVASVGRTQAKVDTGTANVASMMSIGVNEVEAKAGGVFLARILMPADLTLGDVSVRTDYTALADAGIGASPVIAGLVGSQQHDIAKATVTAQANAVVDGMDQGSVLRTEDLQVLVTGNMKANAAGNTPEAEIGANAVMAHDITSAVQGNQSARLYQGLGTVDAAGDVTVESLITTSGATATVSSPSNATSVSIFEASINEATARETAQSTAEIGTSLYYDRPTLTTGKNGNNGAGQEEGSLTAGGNILIRSESEALSARAETRQPQKVGLVTNGNLASKAESGDSFAVNVAGKVTAGGDITLSAKAKTEAKSTGTAPGAYTVANVSSSTMDTNIGSKSKPQTVSMILSGSLKAGKNLSILAENNSSVQSKMNKAAGYTLGGVDISRIPTKTYLTTSIELNPDTELHADKKLSIQTTDNAKAVSKIDESAMQLALNVGTMQGSNEVTSRNTINVLEGAKMTSGGDLVIEGKSNADMSAVSSYDGGYSFIHNNGNVESKNILNRNVEIYLMDNATVESGGDVRIEAMAGGEDKITNKANANGGSLVNSIIVAKAETQIRSNPAIGIGTGVQVKAEKDVRIHTDASLYDVSVKSDSNSGVSGTSSAKAQSYATVINTSKITINPYDKYRSSGKSQNKGNGKTTEYLPVEITSRTGNVILESSSEDVVVRVYSDADTSNWAGKTNAWSKIGTEMTKCIYLDNTKISAPQGGIRIESRNSNKTRTVDKQTYQGDVLLAKASTYMEGVGGSFIGGWGTVKSLASIIGNISNEIRSYQKNGGYLVDLNGRYIAKNAIDPKTNLNLLLTIDVDKPKRAINNSETKKEMNYSNRNDLWTQADEDAKKKTETDKNNYSFQDNRKNLVAGISVSESSETVEGLWRSSSRNRDIRNPGDIYVLDLQVLLTKDVRFEVNEKCRMWRNAQTQEDIYLLPNATRLAMRGQRVRLVQELIDLETDGQSRLASFVISLTETPASERKIPLGARSYLDFSNGELRMPEDESFWLYISELSGEWLKDQFEEGIFRLYRVDPERMRAWTAGEAIPEGEIRHGLTAAESRDGLEWYRIGTENEEEGAGYAYLLSRNPETDEAKLWREDAQGTRTPQKAVAFRNSEADRDGEVRYDVIMLDTAEDEEGTIEAVNDLLNSTEPLVPASLYATLRPMEIEGLGICFSIRGVLFVPVNPGKGTVNLLNGQYTVETDGTFFETPYTRIDRNGTEDLQITLWKGQPVWPEWITDTTAEDPEGRLYELTDGVWTLVDLPVNSPVQMARN